MRLNTGRSRKSPSWLTDVPILARLSGRIHAVPSTPARVSGKPPVTVASRSTSSPSYVPLTPLHTSNAPWRLRPMGHSWTAARFACRRSASWSSRKLRTHSPEGWQTRHEVSASRPQRDPPHASTAWSARTRRTTSLRWSATRSIRGRACWPGCNRTERDSPRSCSMASSRACGCTTKSRSGPLRPLSACVTPTRPCGSPTIPTMGSSRRRASRNRGVHGYSVAHSPDPTDGMRTV